jgi:hypothetical protein
MSKALDAAERRRAKEERKRRGKLNAEVQRRAHEDALRAAADAYPVLRAAAAALMAMPLQHPAPPAAPASPPPPPKPTVVAVNPARQPADDSPVPPPAIVEDASKLAIDVEQIASAAIDQIKEILRHPLDRQDPNFAALLRFLSSTYNTSMTTILRADENRLKRQAISRLPEIAARAAEERRKRDERRTIESVVVQTVTGESAQHDDDGDAA